MAEPVRGEVYCGKEIDRADNLTMLAYSTPREITAAYQVPN